MLCNGKYITNNYYKGTKMQNKQHKQYVIVKVNPWAKSSSIGGSTVSIVELLDIDNDFKHCFTYVSESNWNYDQWQKIYDEDYHEHALVINGVFAKSKGKSHNARDYQGSELINADAKFKITERCNRHETLYQIAKNQGLL